MTIKPFGEYIAITPVKEELQGTLEVPVRNDVAYDLAEIQAVGNGKVAEKPKVGVEKNWYEVPMYRKKGEIVVFRVPQAAIKSKTYSFHEGSDEKTMLIHQGDIIGTISGKRVGIDTFKISGNNVLLEFFETNVLAPGSKIEIPENARAQLTRLRFKVLQIGELAFPDGEIKVGDEVMIDRMRAEPIMLADPLETQGEILLVPKTRDYVFCPSEYIHAVVHAPTPKVILG
jgi:co-chaperonin GroES (HSP10)